MCELANRPIRNPDETNQRTSLTGEANSCSRSIHPEGAPRIPARMEVGVSVYKGKCFCGAVEISVEGDPVGAGYCHCASCRSWSAGPVNAFTLWKPDAVKVTKGQDAVGVFHKTGRSYRKWCRVCGGPLLTDHPER